MTNKKNSYVFGPVPSRRLGRSLGVDLVPHKTCSLNCIYCQIGNSKKTTIERKEYVPTDEVVEQVRLALEKGPAPDVITFSGSGEPTLHSGIGQIIKEIKKTSDVPVVVLTNGTLLFDEDVRKALCKADIVMPNLDAANPKTFGLINRPDPKLVFDKMINGLIRFGKEFKGELLLEVFVVKGINDSQKEMSQIARIASEINPANVQLNTVSRPPAENFAKNADKEDLAEMAGLFSTKVEVIASFKDDKNIQTKNFAKTKDVQNLLARRPCRLLDIANGLGISQIEASKLVCLLTSENLVREISQANEIYFELKKTPE